MAGNAQNKKIDQYVAMLMSEGILNGEFSILRKHQGDDDPDFVPRIITMFCENTEESIEKMRKSLSGLLIDYATIFFHAMRLKGSSSSVGAQRVNLASVNMIAASDATNKEWCIEAFSMICNEYRNLKFNFDCIVKMERKIPIFNAQQK